MADDEHPTPASRLGIPDASPSPASRDGAGTDPPAANRFKPGQSGNPSGGSKASREFRDLAKSMAPLALEKLQVIALRGNGMPAVRACEIIIERAYGKAVQPISGENGGPLELGFGAAPARSSRPPSARAPSARSSMRPRRPRPTPAAEPRHEVAR